MREEQTFFILGVHRSGTTMLQLMLDGHSEIGVCPEASTGKIFWLAHAQNHITGKWHQMLIANALHENLRHYADPAAACFARQALKPFSGKISAREWFAAFRVDYLKQKEASIFGEKTPENLFFLSTIRKIAPGCKFIVILRNPLDVVLSLCEAYNIKYQKGMKTGLLLHFAALVKRGLKALFSKRSMEGHPQCWITYEELVASPDRVLQRICAFLGVEYEEGMKDFQKKDLNSNPNEYQREAHRYLKKPIATERINRYKKSLTPIQIKMLQNFFGGILSRLPYEFESIEAPLPSFIRLRVWLAKISFFLKGYLVVDYYRKLLFQAWIVKLSVFGIDDRRRSP